ncbi:MAG: SDR family NAD(P)-dependent oxidoreductase, partial [Myxococcota bacterium]|nr:SDR family NAD(P)-dependent oxidoreductase [Myxococcota bacterium]
MNLRDRVVLITGGARGIGLACVHALVQKGAKVCVLDLTPGESLPGGATYWKLDVTDRPTFAGVVAEIEKTVGPVDILVNNAGLMPVGEVLDHSEYNDRLQVDVNLHGVLNGVHAVLGSMLHRKRGHIVNIASL